MRIAVKNWASFQHYKDRSPKWIKLHKSILDDYDFQRLPIASKALAPMLWLLASEYENGVIEAEPDEIAFRLRCTEEEVLTAIKPLVQKEFLVLAQDASEVLSEPERGAIPEKSREEKRESAVSIESFDAISVSRKFLDEFSLNGTAMLRAVEEAVSQRSKIREVCPAEAMDEICAEYQAYLDSKPEYRKGTKNWLAECNQAVTRQVKHNWVPADEVAQ